jgi:hypothetical protein
MSAQIPMRYLIQAAREFTLPQIEIVQPQLVICLGLVTFNAMRVACRQALCRTIDRAIESPFLMGTATLWCQAHAGARGVKNRAGFDRVLADWMRMKDSIDRVEINE